MSKTPKHKTSDEPKTVNSMRISEARGIPLLKRPLVRKMLKLALLALVLAALVFGAIYLNNRRNNNTNEKTGDQTSAASIQQLDPAEVVEEFSKEYDEATNDVYGTSPALWDKAALEKAYVSLLYADKIGAFNQVYSMLSMIEAAKMNGLNIDDNSYDIGSEERDAIRRRADENAKSVPSNGDES